MSLQIKSQVEIDELWKFNTGSISDIKIRSSIMSICDAVRCYWILSCKAFVTGRKNWLFSDTQAGAYASSLVYSLVETAKACEVDIYNYLKYILLSAPTGQMPDEELEKLCPWDPDCKAALAEMQRKDQETIFNTH